VQRRFLWAIDVPWDRAGTVEARDFALWLKMAVKPTRTRRAGSPAPGSVNAATGQRYPGAGYAARTRRHARAAVRSFYEYHRQTHGRPLLNPFPKSAGGSDEEVNAHHNPMRPFRRPLRPAPYQPRQPKRVARGIPDDLFNQLFTVLTCDLLQQHLLKTASQGMQAPRRRTSPDLNITFDPTSYASRGHRQPTPSSCLPRQVNIRSCRDESARGGQVVGRHAC
jgi:hypothetical protein